jgi:glucose/mannose-6-phosphate isomerase
MSGNDPMRGWIASFPDMLAEAWDAVPPKGYPLNEGRFTVIGGMGGSGIAGALAASFLQRRGMRILPWRDPELPAWISQDDRFIGVSYSGNTWETASMLEGAIARGVPARVIASGGAIAERAAGKEIPLFTVPGGLAPRASLPWLLSGVLRALGGAGGDEVAETVLLLRAERDAPPEGRDPRRIAEAVDGRLVCLIPVGPAMETVAIRWRSQIVENAKQFAMVSPLPEMAHNEIMAWDFLREAGIRASFRVLWERAATPEPFGKILVALEREAGRSGLPFEIVPPPEGDGLASLLAQVYLGDRVSMELADRRGVAATPVEAISRLRAMAGKEPSR